MTFKIYKLTKCEGYIHEEYVNTVDAWNHINALAKHLGYKSLWYVKKDYCLRHKEDAKYVVKCPKIENVYFGPLCQPK